MIGKDSNIQGAGGAGRVSVSEQSLQDQALLTGPRGCWFLAAVCISVRLGGRSNVRSGQIVVVASQDTGGEGATNRVPPRLRRVHHVPRGEGEDMGGLKP